MKKTITLLSFLLSSFINAQSANSNNETKKLHLGLGYSFNADKENFNNPFNISAIYQLKQWDAIDLNIGARVFVFIPKSDYKNNFSTNLAFNPNVSSSCSFFDTRLNVYLAVGYYLQRFQLTLDVPSKDTVPINVNGFTATPGIKYFVYPKLFLDANYSFLNLKTTDKYDGYSYSETSSLNWITLGVGIAF